MHSLNPLKVATTFALLIAGIHFSWAVLVAVGWAQAFVNFVLWLHFIAPVYVIQPFSWSVALMLIVFTMVISFLAALFFAFVWNRVHLP